MTPEKPTLISLSKMLKYGLHPRLRCIHLIWVALVLASIVCWLVVDLVYTVAWEGAANQAVLTLGIALHQRDFLANPYSLNLLSIRAGEMSDVSNSPRAFVPGLFLHEVLADPNYLDSQSEGKRYMSSLNYAVNEYNSITLQQAFLLALREGDSPRVKFVLNASKDFLNKGEADVLISKLNLMMRGDPQAKAFFQNAASWPDNDDLDTVYWREVVMPKEDCWNMDTSDEALPLTTRAIGLFNRGQFRQALVLCQERLVTYPNDAPALWIEGLCHSSLKEWSKAVDTFNRLLKLRPESRKKVAPWLDEASKRLEGPGAQG